MTTRRSRRTSTTTATLHVCRAAAPAAARQYCFRFHGSVASPELRGLRAQVPDLKDFQRDEILVEGSAQVKQLEEHCADEELSIQEMEKPFGPT